MTTGAELVTTPELRVICFCLATLFASIAAVRVLNDVCSARICAVISACLPLKPGRREKIEAVMLPNMFIIRPRVIITVPSPRANTANPAINFLCPSLKSLNAFTALIINSLNRFVI